MTQGILGRFPLGRISFVVYLDVHIPSLTYPLLQIQAMQWLVRDARPNDALFFHCT